MNHVSVKQSQFDVIQFNCFAARKLVEERITRITDLTMQDTGLWDTKLIHGNP